MSMPALLGAARARAVLAFVEERCEGTSWKPSTSWQRLTPLEAKILRPLLLDDNLAKGRYRVAGETIALDDIGADVQRDRLEAAQIMQRYWITGADSR